jgi:arylsulfatase A-like enzyme
VGRASAQAERLNIVLILFDKCRTDAIGAYGNARAGTPNIDWLASTGARFNNCYTPQALCAPARASIITGLYPHFHGLRRNVYPTDGPKGNHNVYEDAVPDPFTDRRFRLWNNFPLLLHNSGYQTAQIGKWHLGHGNPGLFDTYKGFNSGLPHWIGTPHESLYRPDVQTDDGIDFIEHNAPRPFFLYQSYYAPHEPLDPPKKFLEGRSGQDHAAYHGAVGNLDWNIGRLINSLRKTGVLERTLIIFSADHGRTWLDRPGTEDGMSIAYDDASRIPFIMRVPRLISKPVVWNGGVSLLDIAPTILDATRVSIPRRPGAGPTESPHGVSLLAELKTGKNGWTRPIVMQNLSQKPIEGSQFEDRAIRFGDWKLILRKFDTEPHAPVDELYDLRSDPGETRNLLQTEAGRPHARELADLLRAHAASTGDTLAAELASRF